VREKAEGVEMLSVNDLESVASRSGRTGYVAVVVTGRVVSVLVLGLLNHEMLLRGREEIQLE
jgi:hypothetical protein